jgi:hypothetical protein
VPDQRVGQPSESLARGSFGGRGAGPLDRTVVVTGGDGEQRLHEGVVGAGHLGNLLRSRAGACSLPPVVGGGGQVGSPP